MLKLSFPTRKLKGSLIKVNGKYRDYPEADSTVYGVTNKEGIVITGKDASDDTSNYIVVNGKSFVYNPYRINVGSIGLSNDNFAGIVSPAYVAFKTKNDINPDFLYLYLKSPLGINLIKWYGDRGGVRSALRFNDLEKIDFPDLTYDQQTKALEKIQEFMNINSVLNEEIEKQEIYVQKFRQSILQEVVQGKLVPQDPNEEPASELLKKIKIEKEKLIQEGKIKKEPQLPTIVDEEKPFCLPNSWEWSKLSEMCSVITDGDHQAPPKAKSGIPFLVISDVNNGTIDFNKVTRFVQEDYYESLPNARKTNINDILYTVTGSFGIPIHIKTNSRFVFQRHIALIKPSNLINIYFLLYILKSNFVFNQAKECATGIAQLTVPLRGLRSFVIPLPPLEEQKRIVAKIDNLMGLCNELEEQIIKSKKHSECLMQSILQEAFNSPVKHVKKSNVLDLTDVINQRTVYNAHMISKLGNDIGAIKNEKLNYLSEMVLELSLGGNYRKEAAGPLDIESRSEVKEIFKRLKWFNIIDGNENKKEQYIPDVNLKEHEELFDLCFGDKKSEIDKLLNLFKHKNSEECEAVATLYAVWNDLLIDKKLTSQEDIIEGFYKWSTKKKNFNRQDLYDNLTWMEYHKLIPSGKGKKTIPKSRQTSLF